MATGVFNNLHRLGVGVVTLFIYLAFLGGSDGKESACSAGGPGSVLGSGRSTGEGNGNPLQYPCLGNPMIQEPGGLQSMGLQGVKHD